MHRAGTVRTIVIAAALLGVGALVVQYAPAASASKGLSAPVFTSKAVKIIKQGKPLNFIVKVKSNPVSTISETGTLPPGATFTDNGNNTATLSDPTPLASATPYVINLQAANTTTQPNTTDQTLTLTINSKLPLVRHVFVIMLENNELLGHLRQPVG